MQNINITKYISPSLRVLNISSPVLWTWKHLSPLITMHILALQN